MRGEVTKVILSQDEIQKRVQELGEQITRDYRDEDSLVCVGILKGSTVFLADLIRQINHPNLTTDYMRVSSYGNDLESSGIVKLLLDLSEPIENKNILIVEDIVDTCLTMAYLLEMLKTRNPKSIRVCSLLRKDNAKVHIKVDYVGFDIDKNAFVVGYGLDCAERYRNLPYVGVFTPEPDQ